MACSRNKLYLLLFTACLAGYIWLYHSITRQTSGTTTVDVCLIKHVTNIPCPSCGSTRSVISLTRGDFINAFFINPFGYLVALIMLISPLWVLIDLLMKKSTLFDFYHQMERFLKRPTIAIPSIFLVILNWIWNVLKGL